MEEILDLLYDVKTGNMTPEEAEKKLKMQPYENIGIATIDHHRKIRQHNSEVIYGESKTPDQILKIVTAMLQRGEKNILITRMHNTAAEIVGAQVDLFYDPLSRIGIVNKEFCIETEDYIAVVSAGTSDIPICEEAALTAECMGSRVTRIYDVGVAGIHRLFARLEELMEAKVVIVVAGMEGALASVVGGLVDKPVIAVPTSVGYGANFAGVSALLSMLNSCASTVSVVNIDNGFGAGMIAAKINRIGGTK